MHLAKYRNLPYLALERIWLNALTVEKRSLNLKNHSRTAFSRLKPTYARNAVTASESCVRFEHFYRERKTVRPFVVTASKPWSIRILSKHPLSKGWGVQLTLRIQLLACLSNVMAIACAVTKDWQLAMISLSKETASFLCNIPHSRFNRIFTEPNLSLSYRNYGLASTLAELFSRCRVAF